MLIAGPALDGGAPARGIVDLVRALSAAGHRSLVVSTGGPLTAEVKGFGAECITLDTISINPARILANVPILTGLMRERACDIVHAHGRAAAWSSYLAARRARKPFLTTWYKGYREQNGFKRFYNSVMVRGERVIALSEQIADLVHERYATPWERIKVIPIGIDMRRFDPAAVSAERVAAVRQSWGAGEAVRIILVAGRMLRRKGHHVVIDAARQLRARGVKDFLVVFAGSEPEPSRYAAELWDHVVATGTADVVRTTTALADMPAAYLASCAVVSAALEVEGLQRSILEGQAMGRPVIVSDRGAGSDVLLAGSGVAEDRITGFRFPAGDQNALAAAIIRVFSASESARTAIGLRGRAWIAANFELTMVSEQILALYAELSGPVSGQQRAGSPRAS